MSRLRSAEPLATDAAAPFRFGIAASRFNEEITSALAEGARASLRAHGANDDAVRTIWVAGAFELPLAAALLVDTGVDAVVCVGALIRGETPHFDVLATSTARALHDLSLASRTPVTFGVLTCDDIHQARARAGGAAGNKGAEAAEAAIAMARMRADLRGAR